MAKRDERDFNERLVGAVYREDFPKLEELLAGDSRTNVQDADGRTALMHAVLATPPSARVVKFLLDRGANPNVHDKGQRWTPLHFAARDGSAEIVSLLLSSGAEVDSIDIFGNTPLWRATFSALGVSSCLDCAIILLKAGANPNAANNSGVAPRHLAEGPGWENVRNVLDRSGDVR
jgi:ankyrin repeat protein